MTPYTERRKAGYYSPKKKAEPKKAEAKPAPKPAPKAAEKK